MACEEISQMRQEVCQSLRGSVNAWQVQLQAKWGDPSVYAREEQERLRQDARLAFDLNRRNASLLDDAYDRQAKKQQETHEKRMTQLKRRGYRSGGTHPQSRED